MKRFATLVLILLATLLTLAGCNCPPCPDPTPAPTVTPTYEPTPVATATPVPSVLIDPRFAEQGVIVNIRPTARYKLVAAWCWINGDKASAPAWAQKYMNFPSVGADHSIFGVVVGTTEPADLRLWWPDGETVRSAAGWVDIPLYARFDCQGCGPYNFRFDGGDEILRVGLWKGIHTSYAGVWVDSQPNIITSERPPTAGEEALNAAPVQTPMPEMSFWQKLWQVLGAWFWSR